MLGVPARPQPLPKAEWNWVETMIARVPGTDLSPFFSRLRMNKCVGGNDGFCLLAPSPANREVLARVLRPSNVRPAPGLLI